MAVISFLSVHFYAGYPSWHDSPYLSGLWQDSVWFTAVDLASDFHSIWLILPSAGLYERLKYKINKLFQLFTKKNPWQFHGPVCCINFKRRASCQEYCIRVHHFKFNCTFRNFKGQKHLVTWLEMTHFCPKSMSKFSEYYTLIFLDIYSYAKHAITASSFWHVWSIDCLFSHHFSKNKQNWVGFKRDLCHVIFGGISQQNSSEITVTIKCSLSHWGGEGISLFYIVVLFLFLFNSYCWCSHII